MVREVEAALTRDPSILLRSPNIFTNLDGIFADMLAQIQSNTKKHKYLQRKLQELSGRIASLERKIVASENSLTECPSPQVSGDSAGSVPNDEITRRMSTLESKIAEHDSLLAKNEGAIMTTNRRVDFSEHTLADRTVRLTHLEDDVKQLTLGFTDSEAHDGVLLWKIPEFARRRNEAVSGKQVYLYSPCFFTSRYGYKMCARIYLNGDGMGRGTHISVFLVVMRGQYDALLRWPFRQKVTFMLMDQDNVEHVIDAFRPDPNSSSFQRPRRETNIASGRPMFLSLTELNNHAYVRDDTMFIKVIVDTTDL